MRLYLFTCTHCPAVLLYCWPQSSETVSQTSLGYQAKPVTCFVSFICFCICFQTCVSICICIYVLNALAVYCCHHNLWVWEQAGQTGSCCWVELRPYLDLYFVCLFVFVLVFTIVSVFVCVYKYSMSPQSIGLGAGQTGSGCRVELRPDLVGAKSWRRGEREALLKRWQLLCLYFCICV